MGRLALMAAALGVATLASVAAASPPIPIPRPIGTAPPRCRVAECPTFSFRVREKHAQTETSGRGTVYLNGDDVPLRLPGLVTRGTARAAFVHADPAGSITLRAGGALLVYRRFPTRIGTVVRLAVTVTASSNASCAVGAKGFVTLVDHPDRLTISLPACHSHRYRAGVDVRITRPQIR